MDPQVTRLERDNGQAQNCTAFSQLLLAKPRWPNTKQTAEVLSPGGWVRLLGTGTGGKEILGLLWLWQLVRSILISIEARSPWLVAALLCLC